MQGSHLISSHLSLNHKDRWGTTDFATSVLHFSLFFTALWDLVNSRPVHSLMLSSYLFLCLPRLLPLSLCLARRFWPDLMNKRHDHTSCSLRLFAMVRSSSKLPIIGRTKILHRPSLSLWTTYKISTTTTTKRPPVLTVS